MIIERHRRDTRTRKKHTKKRNCHYQGRVRGDANSNVAVSACDGLVRKYKYLPTCSNEREKLKMLIMLTHRRDA